MWTKITQQQYESLQHLQCEACKSAPEDDEPVGCVCMGWVPDSYNDVGYNDCYTILHVADAPMDTPWPWPSWVEFYYILVLPGEQYPNLNYTDEEWYLGRELAKDIEAILTSE